MLVDTSGLLCLLHQDEPQHAEAVQLYNNTSLHLTHNYVLAEFVPLARVRGLPRSRVLAYTQRALTAQDIGLVWVDEALHQRAVDLLLARADKTYSLCDAVSFVLMRVRGIIKALTTDRHFEEEGFARLLKP